MALEDYFLTPLGLAALASLVVLVVLYLISRKPAHVALPTLQFLGTDPQRAGRQPRLSRLRRSLLFLLQALVLIGCSLALATPYLTVDAGANGDTALVVDGSASMATEDGRTRFDSAIRAARGDVATTTSVVVSRDTPFVAGRQENPQDARATLGGLAPTDTPGDLASAISLATTTAGQGATVHVYSDFADATDWRASVQTARAEGYRVELHQFGGGGQDNVGIVDRTFGRTTVTVTVQNTGDRPATRTVSLNDAAQSVSLQPGDLTTVSFDVPAGGGEVRLAPRDSFPVDDRVAVAAPASDSIRVLLLTNEEDRYLRTALNVIDEVDLRVERLPASVVGEFDVVVFSGVDPGRLLAGNLALARETRRDGGGVVVMAQSNLRQVGLGEFLPVAPQGTAQSTTAPVAVDDALTAGITFPAPGEHLETTLTDGRALVRTTAGTPLIATDSRLGGQVLYYGYDDATTDFPFDVGYPVFWKRALYYAAGRPSLSELNRQTGDRLTFDAPTRVGTPAGAITATSVPLQQVGFYDLPNRRLGVGLLSQSESTVTAPPVDIEGATDGDTVVVEPERSETSRLLSLVPIAVGVALLLVLLEVGYLRYRGDL